MERIMHIVAFTSGSESQTLSLFEVTKMPRKSNSAYRMEVIRKDWGLCDVFETRHDDVNNVWVTSGGDLGTVKDVTQYLVDAQARIINRYIYRYGYGKICISCHRTN